MKRAYNSVQEPCGYHKTDMYQSFRFTVSKNFLQDLALLFVHLLLQCLAALELVEKLMFQSGTGLKRLAEKVFMLDAPFFGAIIFVNQAEIVNVGARKQSKAFPTIKAFLEFISRVEHLQQFASRGV
jgi:hypothetical protein